MSKTPLLDSLLASSNGMQAPDLLRPNSEAFAALLFLSSLCISGAFALIKTLNPSLAQPKAEELLASESVGGNAFIEEVREKLAIKNVGNESSKAFQDGYPALPIGDKNLDPATPSFLGEPRFDALREAKKTADAIERRALENNPEQPEGLAIQHVIDDEAQNESLNAVFPRPPHRSSQTHKLRKTPRSEEVSSSRDRMERIQSETRMQMLSQRDICTKQGIEAIQRWEHSKNGPSKKSKEALRKQDVTEIEDDGRTVLWVPVEN
ncbi:hypothetical protein P7C71_g2725, partial [Lecanoromycetidae sp. Uapishka_2]